LRLNKLRKIPIDSEMYQSVMGRLIWWYIMNLGASWYELIIINRGKRIQTHS
jgi:hypothetical protein